MTPPRHTAKTGRKPPTAIRTTTPRGRPRIGISAGQNIGADISDEAVAFGAALDRYKREQNRPYLTVSDTLEVLHSLGYRNQIYLADGPSG